MMSQLGCVRAEELKAYLLGDLPEGQAQAVAVHLQSCPDCDAEAARFEGRTDAVLSRLRRFLRPVAPEPAARTPLGATVDDVGPIVSATGEPLPRFVAGYEVLGELGRGGMSVVYRARQSRPARLVALKVILGGAHAGADRRARFLAEADAIARLQHPNIIQIYEVGLADDVPFFSMELVEGGSLARRLAGRPQPPDQAAALVETLARAVHYAHGCGIVHRDLKPDNVLLAAACGLAGSASEGTAKPQAAGPALDGAVPRIADFGLALLMQQAEQPRLTVSGAVLGTPEYMAPEQAQGKNREVGPPADVYALGAILYECLTGRPPFRAASPLDTIVQVVADEPVPPRQLNPAVPRDLETVCLKCLEKEPARRYASAARLAEDLRRFQAGEPLEARPIRAWQRALKWARRKPTLAGLVAAVVFALGALSLGGVFFGLYRDQQARAKLQQIERREQFAELWDQGIVAQAAGRFDDARQSFSQALGLLDADEEERKAQVEQRLEQVGQHLGEQRERQRVRAAAKTFWHDDHHAVLFHEISLDRLNEADNRARILRLAPIALGRFGLGGDLAPETDARRLLARRERFESPEQLKKVAEGCYEILLAWARAEVGAGRVGKALDRLALAEALARIHGLEVPRAFYLRRAEARLRAGDRDGARADEVLAARRKAHSPQDHFQSALQFWNEGKVKEATAACEEALQGQADHFWAGYLLAVCSLQSKNWEAARGFFSGCLGRRPDFLWARLQRAVACIGMREWAKGEDDLRVVLAEDKDGVLRYAALVSRGTLRMEQGRPDEALPDFQEALRQAGRGHADGHDAWVGLARLYQRQKDWVAAVQALDRALACRKVPDLYRERARAHAQRGDRQAARRDLETLQALERGSRQPQWLLAALVDLGRLKRQAGEHEAALADLNEALRLRADHPEALREKAQALLALPDRHREAGDVLDRLLRAERSDRGVFFSRATIHVKLGEHAAAVAAYSAALGLKEDAETRCERGWAYLRTDSPKLARDDFEASLRLGPRTFRALCGRGLAQVRLGKVDSAVASAEEAVRLDDGPHSLLQAACVYARATAVTAARAQSGQARRKPAPGYTKRAVDLLEQAVQGVPRKERGDWWRRWVQEEDALLPVRGNGRYRQMDAMYRR